MRSLVLEADTGKQLGYAARPQAQSVCWVQAHMEAMVSRRNSINGRLYRDDPTIFAWDLMNEPRCDCFPDEIPAPPELVSCRPECAQKMQVLTCSLSTPRECAVQPSRQSEAPQSGWTAHYALLSCLQSQPLAKHTTSQLLGALLK